MSLRAKLICLMLFISLLPTLLFAAVAHHTIRQNAIDTAVDTSTALFESKMMRYNQVVERLRNTSLDIISNMSLHLLFRPMVNREAFADLSTFRRWQIVTNNAEVKNSLKSHHAAQVDVLDGIGLVLKGGTFPSVDAGIVSLSPGAIARAEMMMGTPILYADTRDGQTDLSICVSFANSGEANDVLGTCVLSVKEASLFGTLLPSDLAEEEQVFVLDENGILLFHSDPLQPLHGRPDSAMVMPVSSGSVSTYFVDEAGETFIVTGQQTASIPGWSVYYAIPYAYFVKSSTNLANMILPFALLSASLAVVGAILCAWNFYRPIRSLTQAISGMSGRNLVLLKRRNTPEEIGLLVASFNRLIEDINGLLRKVEEEADNTRRAEIVAVRAQISPHFLYNTLNGIKCMAAMKQTDEIQTAVTSLIALLRASIGNARDVVSLRAELEHVSSYVQLQRYRLDLCFQYRIDAPEALMDLAVPHFLLQPIVENALIHAFDDISNTENAIEVRATATDSMLTIQVEDNGLGLDPERLDILNSEFAQRDATWLDKVGLHNAIERCRHLFGDAVNLRIENTGHGMRVTLTFPRMVFQEGQTDYRQRDA